MPEVIQILLEYAHTPEHPNFRSVWGHLYETHYILLERRLSRQFSNIDFADIQDIVIDAFIAFQQQLTRTAALREDVKEERQAIQTFIENIHRIGFHHYLFNLSRWKALAFLQVRLRVTEIDAALPLANQHELYQDYEVEEFRSLWLKKIEKLLGPTLYPVFKAFTIEGWSHKKIAAKFNIDETNSIDRNRRAIGRLRKSNLMRQIKESITSKNILILFIYYNFI